MLIAIDYDDTFTADPELFKMFVELGKARGHSFVCVTARRDGPCEFRGPHRGDQVREAMKGLMPIVFAKHDYKHEAAVKAGYYVDVWVDDHPEWVRPIP
jgi:hypothetical protein